MDWGGIGEWIRENGFENRLRNGSGNELRNGLGNGLGN